MIQARFTDGVNPATAAKRRSSGSPNTAVRYRFRKVMVQTMAKKMEICSPETAATWRIPVTFSRVSKA